ncbi:MAG: hypothetical protein LBV30_07925 [Propionibacteriaceae bacterium]|nr:hypothetical protein [Propionibacteriaceae bacterium]
MKARPRHAWRWWHRVALALIGGHQLPTARDTGLGVLAAIGMALGVVGAPILIEVIL